MYTGVKIEEDGMMEVVETGEMKMEEAMVIVKEGWLMKRGEVIKNWRPR